MVLTESVGAAGYGASPPCKYLIVQGGVLHRPVEVLRESSQSAVAPVVDHPRCTLKYLSGTDNGPLVCHEVLNMVKGVLTRGW